MFVHACVYMSVFVSCKKPIYPRPYAHAKALGPSDAEKGHHTKNHAKTCLCIEWEARKRTPIHTKRHEPAYSVMREHHHMRSKGRKR